MIFKGIYHLQEDAIYLYESGKNYEVGEIEKIERLSEEKQALADDIKDIYSEAKSVGFDPKIMRIIIKERKMDESDLAEQEALLDLYKHALANTPIEQHIKGKTQGAESTPKHIN